MNKPLLISSHDAAFKRFMMNISNAKDFFFIHLSDELKSYCDFSTLKLQNSSFIDIKLRSRMSDILYSVKTKKGNISIYFLIEHQSRPDKMIAWRMMHYAFCTMNQHLQQGYTSLPLVVPILFYHGKRKPYPFSVNWLDCFPLSTLANQLYLNNFALIDLNSIDDEILLTHRKAAVMEIAMKHVNSCDDLDKLAMLLSKAINQKNCSDEDTIAVVQYLFSIMDAADFESIINKIAEQVDNHRETIMNIAWRLENKGFKLGKMEGIEIGKNEGIEIGKNEGIEIGKKIVQIQLAKNLLKENVELEFIERITGLSIQELKILILT
ncbi:Rpn family recombination-promoting nuclease/putative transposase [Proteus mirabilis]|uniref:Transposase/plasmid-related protein n=2 Tax=Proteus mirabilis TaxID=584 RepID=B4EYU7_PROMH|nr:MULTISPECIES: Rpn family recombination-promoting nuclease/putative transposase [Proteus]EHZ8015711.1 Rpn family recombination-promoting nuclease/putative transposase [Proteus mirabilis]EKT8676583.1 Rpn family recombination-promoting nuclease/putative transposase [Proteus mirabilis]EKU5732459.1 Rpn family recombination-promoting nuclease/putative transposase [Proteus mirabilis]EKV2710848.1 Rpn family recombination-promoting nuclease/putative transposase [Proteus mirabilis]EKX5060817.1 Rpn fa